MTRLDVNIIAALTIIALVRIVLLVRSENQGGLSLAERDRRIVLTVGIATGAVFFFVLVRTLRWL